MSNYKDKMDSNHTENDETIHRSRVKNKKSKSGLTGKVSTKSRKKRSEKSSSAAAVSTSGEATAKKLDKKKVLKILLCVFIAIILIGIIYVAAVIIKAPKIETDNIYSMLSQSSVLYDDSENIIDTAYGEQNRTIVEINEIPEHVQNAFIALEDKTFRTHNGFNIIRIFGAIKESLFGGGQIGGTSTITQQLARNLYLGDEMYKRSINRKIKEAYYSVILESKLNKDQILEAYLNTIYFGCGNGIQTASQAYFSKDVSELTIAEAAALAAIPQMPSEYALVVTVSASEITEDTPNLITKNGEYAYLWNDTAKNRMATCLMLMHEQGYISDEQYEEAKTVEIKDIVNPNLDALNTVSNYFADYVIEDVISDLQENGYSEEQATDLVYNGGIQIYTTMDSQAQSVIEKEFANPANFPKSSGYAKDKNGNILDDHGNPILYPYSSYINGDGSFALTSDEYKMNDDGSMTVYTGKRLNIYNTTVQGKADYSVEFKKMYVIEDGTLYVINGGYINIPQGYKSRDAEDNLIVSAEFFKDYPNFFTESDGRMVTTEFTLNQKVIQPQSAMTIIDNSTGQIKAMTGGRNTQGRKLFNRATSPRQPGSSLKPISVYAAALQKSFDLQAAGNTFSFTDNGFDAQGAPLWGNSLTTASIVDDEPTTINGRVWPKNSYSGYHGLYTFRTALQQSVNVCAVKILSQVGADYSADIVEKFGISTLQREGSANDLNLSALGMGGMAKGASTLEMASAYTTFVNNGVHKSYSSYTKVTTRTGDLLLEPKTEETKVLDPGVAWIMRDVLLSVVSQGIGSPAAISGIQVGGKTGTTDDRYDIWFCGFTPTYSAALWIGNDVNMSLSSYSNSAARLWGKIVSQIDGARGGQYSARPGNVVSAAIDTKSGLLATDASGSDVRTEYFTSGTQPTASDNVHKTVNICNQTGYLATPSCTDVSSRSGVMRPYIPNGKVGDIKNELPHYYCNAHNPDPNSYPVEPGKDVTIMDPIAPPPKDDEDQDDDSGDNQGNNQGKPGENNNKPKPED